MNHLVTEPVKLTGCPRCGNYTITGMSGGIFAITDPGQLTVGQEIAARLAGKTIYDLIPFGLHFYLEYRSLDRVKAGRPHPVVATHKCERTAVPMEPKPDIPLTTIPAVPLPDDPPF